jgi:hypothetical protein
MKVTATSVTGWKKLQPKPAGRGLEVSLISSVAIAREQFLNEFSRELEAENAAIFAGAGLSADAGFVNWKQLLEPFAKEIGLDVHRESDLVRLAQFHENRHNSRSSLNDAIFNDFTRRHSKVTPSHKLADWYVLDHEL